MSTYTLAPLSDRQQKESSKKRLLGSMISAAALAGRAKTMSRHAEGYGYAVNARGVAESLANTLTALNTNYQNTRGKFDADVHAEIDTHARDLIDVCNGWEDAETPLERVKAAELLRSICFDVVGTMHHLVDIL